MGIEDEEKNKQNETLLGRFLGIRLYTIFVYTLSVCMYVGYSPVHDFPR